MFKPAARLVSLDVFRGATIASMVLVNNQVGPDAYAPLRHASWHGWTFTDLVFPFFVWIVGLALTLSTARRIERGDGRSQLLKHIAGRAALIFLVGLLLNAMYRPDLAHLRIPGVLQRIALCYLFAATIYLYSSAAGRIAAVALLLAGYTALMHPGGYERNTNLSDQVDQALLTGHLYTPTRDPEGPLSTLPAIATCLLGVLAGDWIRTRRDGHAKAIALIGTGIALVALGVALDPLQPINKNIWTPTYVLLTGGLAAATFGASYWIIDVAEHRGAWIHPWVIFGMNAMAVYIFHGLLGRAASITGIRPLVYDSLQPAVGAANASLFYSLLHVMASFLFAWVLYRRQWFLKL
jgi:predicted acyltransferase